MADETSSSGGAAYDRLEDRYGYPLNGPDNAMSVVVSASSPERSATTKILGYPESTAEDCLDALRLVAGERARLDRTERALIDAARARGATWRTIGEVLGYTASGARQGAVGRRARLGADETELAGK